jgi:uncharacterized protein (TIGR00369 family)
MALAVTKTRLRRLLSEAPFTRVYGFKVHSVADGECTLHVPFQTAFERPGGLVSGPVFMAAADVAMWLAIVTKLGAADMSVTAKMTTAFLNAARQEDFYCTAKILKLGTRLIYGTAECVTDEKKLLTHHTMTYIRPDTALRSAVSKLDRP